MSRIHEALKKAAEESAAEITPKTPMPSLELGRVGGSHSDLQPPKASVLLPLPGSNGVETSSGTLQFEELRNRCVKPNWQPDMSRIVFSNSGHLPIGAEQFRTLRSRLYQIREKQPLRKLLVTSAVPREGKSFVACNLAQAIVRQHERRTLLIDSDFRCPTLHASLGAPGAPGLSNYLDGEADEFTVVQRGPQDNLFFISAGKAAPNSTELFSNGRLKLLLDRLAPLFDWVILDSPPALLVSDAQVLSTFCDGVLVVVRATSTPFDLVQRACQEFRGRNLIGAVLNYAEMRDGYRSYYYPHEDIDAERRG